MTPDPEVIARAARDRLRALDAVLDILPQPQEASMDVRTPPIDRQDAKEMAIQNAVAQLRSAAYALPGTGHPDFAFRDMAFGVAHAALGAGGYDWERKLLSEAREAHRCLDAAEEVQCWERVEEIAFTLKREAEERCV